MVLFVVLLLAWILGLSVFHVAGGFIHILLIVAVISLILHFVRGRSSYFSSQKWRMRGL
jgi:Family of unknown function (DUF5670)